MLRCSTKGTKNSLRCSKLAAAVDLWSVCNDAEDCPAICAGAPVGLDLHNQLQLNLKLCWRSIHFPSPLLLPLQHYQTAASLYSQIIFLLRPICHQVSVSVCSGCFRVRRLALPCFGAACRTQSYFTLVFFLWFVGASLARWCLPVDPV